MSKKKVAMIIEPPKIFWKYFDSYRRKLITLEEFARLSAISIPDLKVFLAEIGT